jgi:hypothetical protein
MPKATFVSNDKNTDNHLPCESRFKLAFILDFLGMCRWLLYNNGGIIIIKYMKSSWNPENTLIINGPAMKENT